ncbi:MAG: divisome protein SepX/GlpR [Marmoricola sp.]
MDLSGLIFVALFVGWAIYLIPKFMRDQEELATTRSLQDFSARLRVFAATRSVAKQNLLGPDEPTVEISMDEIQKALDVSPAQAVRLPSRAAAKKAAKRRRRVLLVLMVVTAAVTGLAVAGIGPIWTPAIPVAIVLLFLLTARRSVRRAAKARKAAVRAASANAGRASAPAAASPAPVAPAPIITHETDVEVALIARIEADNAADNDAAAAADRLWDPVPVTLPTYLDKPVAHRTVMSIELNRGIVSSGHDAADTELVRAAEAAAAEEAAADLEAPRRAAGA